jgi:hypothetical protein
MCVRVLGDAYWATRIGRRVLGDAYWATRIGRRVLGDAYERRVLGDAYEQRIQTTHTNNAYEQRTQKHTNKLPQSIHIDPSQEQQINPSMHLR